MVSDAGDRRCGIRSRERSAAAVTGDRRREVSRRLKSLAADGEDPLIPG
jgi:hypothetical protein